MAKHFEISEIGLKAVAKEAALNAIRENIALGLPTTTLVDGNIVEISPDNSIRIVKKLNLGPTQKLTKKHFTLE